MIVGSVAMMIVATRQRTRPAPAVQVRVSERPWLSREAADQIVVSGGQLGPLFAGIDLGGPSPTAADRARIETFACTHDVEVHFEVAHDELVAVRFAVTYGGCCGYEAADALAARLARTRYECACLCGDRDNGTWLNNWATVLDDGTYLRGRVRVNRVELRWELADSRDELVARAVALLGTDRDQLLHNAGDRWTASTGRLEVPYAASEERLVAFQVAVEHGVVAGVALDATELGGEAEPLLETRIRARWGTPRVVERPSPETRSEEAWTFRVNGRLVEARLSSATLMVRYVGTWPTT